ncbi:MAG: hypothetical protein BGO57_12250 [Sphingomonadales bacterium 63-6]|nr:MAG: hypothetical protein BGO57_12250 [Sphingomonadales bacterium 63-6]
MEAFGLLAVSIKCYSVVSMVAIRTSTAKDASYHETELPDFSALVVVCSTDLKKELAHAISKV